MANRYWVNDDADGDWSGANNWSATSGGAGGAATPTGSDDVFFNAASSNDNCTLSAAASCLSLTIGTSGSAYTGTLDAATYDVTIGTGGLDCTYGGSATITWGSGKPAWTCSGDFDFEDIGTASQSQLKLTMIGAGTSLKSRAMWFYDLTINAAITISGGECWVGYGILTVSDTLTIATLLRVDRDIVIQSGGDIIASSAQAMLAYEALTLDIQAGGTFTGTNISWTCHRAIEILTAATIGAVCTFKTSYAPQRSVIFPAGTTTFTGPVTFESAHADGLVVDTTANGTIDFQNNLTITETTGNVTLSKGTGNIHFTGTNNQTITPAATFTEVLDDITVNKTAGDLTLAGDVYTDSFTGTSTGTGEFNPAGYTIDSAGACDWAAAFKLDTAAAGMNACTWVVGGNFTADGQTLNATAAWTLTVTGTAVASGTGAVAYSDASGGTQIDASAGPWTDNNNNTNWNFGGAVAAQSIMSLTGVGA